MLVYLTSIAAALLLLYNRASLKVFTLSAFTLLCFYKCI